MTFLGIIIILIGRLLIIATGLIQLLVIADIIISWTGIAVSSNQYTRIYFTVLNYIYRPIRRYVPAYLGGLDFSPMVAFVVLWFVKNFIAYRMIEYGYELTR
jgi:YggT family protein